MERNKKTIRVPGAEIQVEEHPGYLHALVSGPEDSVEISLKCGELICQEAEKRGIRRILIEEDFPNELNTGEMFEVGRKTAQAFPLGTRIAHIDRNAEHHDLNVFGEIVAVKRGLEIRAFPTIEGAEEWLTEGTERST